MEIKIKVKNQIIEGILENQESEKLVILAHGFSGDMQGPDKIFEKLSDRLQKENFSVLRFNFRGTSPSEGKSEDMTLQSEVEDLKEVINFAKKKGFKKICVVGESMGGAVALDAYTTYVNCLVFWYPCFDFIDSDFKNLLTEESKLKLKQFGFVESWGFRTGENFLKEIPKIKLYNKISAVKCPILFLHGDMDSDVPYHQSEKAFNLANKPKEIHIIKGADHCFKKEQDQAISLTMDFLRRYFF